MMLIWLDFKEEMSYRMKFMNTDSLRMSQLSGWK